MYGNDLNSANQRRAMALRGGGARNRGGNVSNESPFSTGRPTPMAYTKPQAGIMDTIKQGVSLYDKAKPMYEALTAGNMANTGSALGGATGTGAGGSLTMDLGAGSGATAGQGATAADAGASAASAGTSALGTGLAYLGAAKTGLDFVNAMGHKQGVEGRNQGNVYGQVGAAGQGAATGASFGSVVPVIGNIIGAIAGAAAGNETYQMKHGNREGDLKPVIGGGEDFDFEKSLKYYLEGGPLGADMKGWFGW